MRSLADYEGGSWPPIGWHTATVSGCENEDSAQKHTPGIKFTFQVDEREATKTFWLTEKAMWVLANFAMDCGLSEQQRREYDVDSYKSHRILVGKKVQIRVAKQATDDRYHEIAEFAAVGENVSDSPADPRVDRSAEVIDIPASELKDVPF